MSSKQLAETVASQLSFRDTWPSDEDHAWAVHIVRQAIQDGQFGFTVDTAIGKLSGDKLIGYISQLEFKAEELEKIKDKRQRLFELYGGKGEVDSEQALCIRVQNETEDRQRPDILAAVKELLANNHFSLDVTSKGIRLRFVGE